MSKDYEKTEWWDRKDDFYEHTEAEHFQTGANIADELYQFYQYCRGDVAFLSGFVQEINRKGFSELADMLYCLNLLKKGITELMCQKYKNDR